MNSASMDSMKQAGRILLRELMGDQDGWGTDEGRAVFGKLIDQVEAHPEVQVFQVSLSGVRRTDSSFPRESVMELARRYRKRLGFCLIDATSADLLENWDFAAQKKEQPLFVWNGNNYRIIGPRPTKGTARLVDFVCGRRETRASDAADNLSLSLTNASTKLKQLWEQGFVLRREEIADSGGIEFVYIAIR
jgi:hypothetical protein